MSRPDIANTTTEEHVQAKGVARVQVTYNADGTVTVDARYYRDGSSELAGRASVTVKESVYNYDGKQDIDVTRDTIKAAIAQAGDAA